MVTVSALGLMGLCMTLILRQYNKELSIILSGIICIFLLYATLNHIQSFLELMNAYVREIPGGGLYMSILIKVLITAYAADFTAQLCRDAGEGSIAGKIELAGKVIICMIVSPILISILELISNLLAS